MFLFPSRTLGGVLALTREAVTALRDALNQLPLPPAPPVRGQPGVNQF